MSKWLIEISDVVTGTLDIRGVKLVAGRTITDDPDIAAVIAQKNSKLYQVTEIGAGEKVEEGSYDTSDAPATGMLTRDDMARQGPEKKACAECGAEFKQLNQHARLSGHDVWGVEAKEAAEAEASETAVGEPEAVTEAPAAEEPQAKPKRRRRSKRAKKE